jgi:hypothetical protein
MVLMPRGVSLGQSSEFLSARRGKGRLGRSVSPCIQCPLFRLRRGTHLGGPGKDDYQRCGGKIHGEVKRYKKPLTRSQVQRERWKGRNEIISDSGFTPKAKRYAKRYKNVKLIHPRKPKPSRGLFDLFW